MIAARRHSAFTLVELIVASTLTVMVGASTVVILRSASASRRGLDRQMAVQQQARLAVQAVTTALRNACRGGKVEGRLVGLAGEASDEQGDRIRLFVVSRTTVRPGQPESDVKEVEFFLRELPDGSRPGLMRRTDPTRNKRPDGGGVLECVAEDVVSFELSYHDGAGWRREWPRKMRRWPFAVRVRLVIANKDWPQGWPVTRIVTFPHHPSAGAGDKPPPDRGAPDAGEVEVEPTDWLSAGPDAPRETVSAAYLPRGRTNGRT